MGEARESSWTRSLAEVEQAVHGCLSALQKYETAFAAVLADQGGPSPKLVADHSVIDEEWTARLAAAQSRADEVERLLVEQQTVWNDWREIYTRWRQSLEQPVAASRGN